MQHPGLSLVALFCLAAAGCQRPTDLIPVEGQITYGGGEWPTTGVIFFVPQQVEPPAATRPGLATFDKDGRFAAKTGSRTGLTPGTYAISIDCWEEVPHPGNMQGKSWIDQPYRKGPTENYSIEVPASSTSPVRVQFDVPHRP